MSIDLPSAIDDDPPEDWFANWTREDERDRQRRGVLQRVMQWWRAH